ncbi:uncharacterized protein LOC107411245 isoform X2 [Ziziphus jujuba]|uniref:Uncharacterized protein LOC107411245 isoform X2 n=1 Tax=Ziziphus jujuba TaxID=326968 RepID=A0ABM3ZSB8_ZIZJJ|nr:uncharacterized protein LOC107411245 isoform X2 [Ziziphus jujuba]
MRILISEAEFVKVDPTGEKRVMATSLPSYHDCCISVRRNDTVTKLLVLEVRTELKIGVFETDLLDTWLMEVAKWESFLGEESGYKSHGQHANYDDEQYFYASDLVPKLQHM